MVGVVASSMLPRQSTFQSAPHPTSFLLGAEARASANFTKCCRASGLGTGLIRRRRQDPDLAMEQEKVTLLHMVAFKGPLVVWAVHLSGEGI
jgi:hypothetical protein